MGRKSKIEDAPAHTASETLEVYGMSQSEFGKALVETSRERERKAHMDVAISEVRRLLAGTDTIRERIRRDERFVSIYKRRLTAIELGDFTYDPARFGPGINGGLVYKDEELNEPC